MCMSAASIGVMITAYYIGFAVGGVFFTVPDNYGRRKALIFGMVLSCVS